MTTPHCPHCNAQGLEHLAFEPLAAFALVYCKQCGAIYGAVPCPQPAAGPAADLDPPEFVVRPVPVPGAAHALALLGNADLSIKQPLSLHVQESGTKMAGMAAPGSGYLPMAFGGPPLCLIHRAEMRERVIPAGYLNAGRRLWICPDFETCHQWELGE